MNTTEQTHHAFQKPHGDSSAQGPKANPLECNICFEDSFEPVVTPCGHIYCWGCIYKWFKAKEQNNFCPVCNAVVTQEKLIPIYSKNEKPGTRKHDESIPKRPKPEREERPRNENGAQGNGQNPAGDFFNRMYFGGGFGFGNVFLSGINFRTQNMSLNIAVVPILISVFFSLFINLLGAIGSDDVDHDPRLSQPYDIASNRNIRPWRFGLSLDVILLIGFLCLSFLIKKIMR